MAGVAYRPLDGSRRHRVSGDAPRHAVVLDDPSDTWSHGVARYSSELGAFSVDGVRLIERGPVQAIIRCESRFDRSTLVEGLVLGRDARALEIRVTLDWHQPMAVLKLRIATVLDEVTATSEVPYGAHRSADRRPRGARADLAGPGRAPP
jgi:alpha-mannosidase